MIETVEGRGVGAGKSYYVVTRIITTLRMGGTVWASDTFVIKWPELCKLVEERFGVLLEADQFVAFPRADTWRLHEITPPGTDDNPVLIVVDEAHIAFNARDWSDKAKRPFFEWLTQSRHDNNDVIFISQHANNMDKQIARLVTYVQRVRNMNNFPIPFVALVFRGKFCVSTFDQDGKTLFKKGYVRQDRGIFGCYISKAMSGSHKRLNATVPRKRLQTKKSRNPIMKFLIFLFIGGLCWGGYQGWKFYHGKPAPVIAIPAVLAAASPDLKVSKGAVVKIEAPKFRVVKEEFRGSDMRTFLRTDKAEYSVGTMSAAGLVKGIQGHVVLLHGPMGELVYVVAEDARGPGVASNFPVVVDRRDALATVMPIPSQGSEEDAIGRRVAGLSPKAAK